MLNHNAVIYAHHVQKNFDFKTPVGKMSKHPTKPGLWGLTNLTKDNWTYTSPKNETSVIETGKNAPLVTGAKINFGAAEGLIE